MTKTFTTSAIASLHRPWSAIADAIGHACKQIICFEF